MRFQELRISKAREGAGIIMPEPTTIEAAMLSELQCNADKLKASNGNSPGDTELRRVVADTARVVVAIAQNGGPSWVECRDFREEMRAGRVKRGDWKMALAFALPTCSTILAIVWKVFD